MVYFRHESRIFKLKHRSFLHVTGIKTVHSELILIVLKYDISYMQAYFNTNINIYYIIIVIAYPGLIGQNDPFFV